MTESNNNNTKCEPKGKSSYVWVILIVTLLACVAFAYLTISYKNNFEEIISVQKKDHQATLDALDKVHNPYIRKNDVFFKELGEHLDNHAARTEALLQLEYGKLQSDFNFISIWGAVITIVFLVFSIYSMFKVDQLQSQSQDSYNKIADFHTKAHELSNEIDSELTASKKKITEETEKSIKAIQDKTKKAIDDQSKSIQEDFDKRFNEQMKKIKEVTNLLNTATSLISTLSKNLNEVSQAQEEGSSQDDGPEGNNE